MALQIDAKPLLLDHLSYLLANGDIACEVEVPMTHEDRESDRRLESTRGQKYLTQA